MAESMESPSHPKSEPRSNVECPSEGDSAPKAKLCFEISKLAISQALSPGANTNPFASLGEGNRGIEACNKLHEDSTKGWSFQGKNKHVPKLVSPRHDPHQSPFPTSHLDTTLGGKRSQTYSEVHHTFFTSLGILVPPNQEFCRARIWLVLTREKNSQKETLVHSKNQALPNLPLNIRIIGPSEAEWTHNSALADITQRLKMELEEKVLRYKLALKDRLHFEWSWQEELNRGGMECTILTHINTRTSALSIQNKRHLHWKAAEDIPGMNNEVEFSAPAHNLLVFTRAESTTHQAHKNHTTNIQASPQAARKNQFTKLDIMTLEPTQMDSVTRTRAEHEADDGGQDSLPSANNKT